MAIKGHKERALLRRGYHIQEALQRRPTLNEISIMRRSLILESKDELTDLCDKYPNSVFCELKNKIESSNDNTLFDSVGIIYKFFTVDLKNSNTKVFQKVIKTILGLDSWQNAIKVIASTMKKGQEKLISLDKKEVEKLDDEERQTIKKTKDKIKFILNQLEGTNTDISEEYIEELLKNIRQVGYSEYEKSFAGDNFDLIKGRWKLPKLELETKTFWEIILDVYNGKQNPINLINHVVKKVKDNQDEIFQTAKADLYLKRDLLVGDEIVIPANTHIEVKKMEYFVDSYMSEFYAIYKDSSLVKKLEELNVDQNKFLNLYNGIIDQIYLRLEKESQDIIKRAEEHIFGIIYDKNILIPKISKDGSKNFEFYWSNKGQRACDKDHRLSIRFRPVKNTVVGYEYDSKTHSTILKPVTIKAEKESSGNKIFCPIT